LPLALLLAVRARCRGLACQHIFCVHRPSVSGLCGLDTCWCARKLFQEADLSRVRISIVVHIHQ
jgi:hypothetical protein